MALVQSLVQLLIAIIVFIVPGYIWSFVFLPNQLISSDRSKEAESKTIGITERTILSIGLSVVLVSLSGFIASALLGFQISEVSSGITALLASLVGLVLVELTSMGSILRCYRRVSSAFMRLVRSLRKEN